jgi:hypothetical protein
VPEFKLLFGSHRPFNATAIGVLTDATVELPTAEKFAYWREMISQGLDSLDLIKCSECAEPTQSVPGTVSRGCVQTSEKFHNSKRIICDDCNTKNRYGSGLSKPCNLAQVLSDRRSYVIMSKMMAEMDARTRLGEQDWLYFVQNVRQTIATAEDDQSAG